MYIVRDIFQLRFGVYKEAKACWMMLMGKAYYQKRNHQGYYQILQEMLTVLFLKKDMILLSEYEKSLGESMGKAAWKKWYEKFKQHVASSHREILKQEM